MFVYNFNLNKSKIFKIIFFIVVIILIIFFSISAFKIFSSAFDSKNDIDTCLPNGHTANISPENYTNVLKAVHENIDTYIGQSIKFSGYIYRVNDFSNEEFVLARDMIIDSNNQTLVVGFLCKYSQANKYQDKTWVEITGKITKGNYHGEIPVIEIESIKKIDKPDSEFVYPPYDTYVPTSILISRN